MTAQAKQTIEQLIQAMPSAVRIQGSYNRGSISLDGKYLSPFESLMIYRHSPDGFSWGYSGSGPAQLALAILLHYTNDRDIAMAWYQRFKFDFVAGLPARDFDDRFNLKQIMVDIISKQINASK